MNIYEKIQKVRVEFSKLNIKMTGHNGYAEYDYFELNDFLKPLNELMLDNKMTAIASFTGELATLTAINFEKPEEVYTISSPFGAASLKGCHEVQNIGAVETYQRRYLYQAMFDISEHDGINAVQGKPNDKKEEKPKQEPPKPLTLEDAKVMEIDIGDKTCKLGELTTKQLLAYKIQLRDNPAYKAYFDAICLILTDKARTGEITDDKGQDN